MLRPRPRGAPSLMEGQAYAMANFYNANHCFSGEPGHPHPVHPDRPVPGAAALLRRPVGHRHGRAHHPHRSPRLSDRRRVEDQANLVPQNHG